MTKLRFGIVGQYQSGKSLLINCLLKRHVATVGVGLATTHTVVNYAFSESEFAEIVYDNGEKETCGISRLKGIDTDKTIKTVNVFLNNDFLRDYTLTDMPGFGYDEKDNMAALNALTDLDYAIVVVSNEKSFGTESSQYKDIRRLESYNIPYYFILNCKDMVIADKWSPFSDINEGIMSEDRHVLEFYKPIRYPFEEGCIPIVNLMWYWYCVGGMDDEILIRKEIRNAVNTYELLSYPASQIKEASNFHLIQRIFDMDNRAYLELKKEIQTLKDEICPVGTIQAFAFNKIPSGWIVCDGRKLLKDEYKELFEAIGYTFTDRGYDLFCIPDLRGRFIRGWDKDQIFDKSKREFGSYQDDAIQSHKHNLDASKISISVNGEHSHSTRADKRSVDEGMLSGVSVLHELRYSSGNDTGGTSSTGAHSHNLSINANPISLPIETRYAEETRPKNCALLYCIRVK
ncbi:MAG: tail fiber protein [Bacteroidales bacterium]|nr:tail fiber protein [Bacteroidales bacterium]